MKLFSFFPFGFLPDLLWKFEVGRAEREGEKVKVLGCQNPFVWGDDMMVLGLRFIVSWPLRVASFVSQRADLIRPSIGLSAYTFSGRKIRMCVRNVPWCGNES